MSERQKKRLAQREANRLKRRMIEKVLSSSRISNVAFNLNLLVDGWLELESDPGTFSLLIEDFGCFGAQVDEIYDLEQKFDGPVFGFIFLFKWLNNQQNDRLRNQKSTSTNNNNNNSSTNNNNSTDHNGEQPSPEQKQWSYVEDENIISEMFFAKQMISNSCATHALISILLNCDYGKLRLGPVLSRLKEHTKIMDPESKGYAIGNLPELAKAHNSHASYSSLYNRNRLASHSSGMSYMISGNQRTNLQQQKQHEAYHFVSYIPIKNRLYELDGLKNYPIDHGPFGPKEDWTEKFRSVIKQRLLANKTGEDSTVSNDIRYNLMAVVPDKRSCLSAELKKLTQHQKVVEDSISRLTRRVFTPMSVDVDIPNPPYSPLSNGTLSASETGSVCNSPRRKLDETFSEDEGKIDKYFFIKFDQQGDTTSTKEENSQPAHKNCIFEIESTNVHPINLTADALSGPDEKTEKGKSNNNNNNNNNNDTGTNKKPTNNCNDVTDMETTDEPHENSEKNQDLKQDRTNSFTSKLPLAQETQTNGVGSDTKVNEIQAHNNEKYNLSKEPPFDFNILDEMQHVHFGKSTLKDMKGLSRRLDSELTRVKSSLKDEIEKRRKYKIDNSRRTHNYEPFIMTFLSMLAKQGKLADLIEKDLGIISSEEAVKTAAPAPQVVARSKTVYQHTAKTATPTTTTTNNNNATSTAAPKAKPKYKYVSTGRPVGRPRKNPLVPPPVKK